MEREWDDLSDDELEARLEQRRLPEWERRWAIANRDCDPQARHLISQELGE